MTRVALALVALALALTACSSGGAPPAAPQTRTVDVGSGPVEVPARPMRIAVLSGSLAGSFYALGAPVAGTDTSVLGVQPDASGFPPIWSDAARRQGTVALSSGGAGVNLEGLAALGPDLIVGGGQGITAVQAERVLPQLRQIAPTVLVPRTVTAWQDQLSAIAKIVGTEDRVAPLIENYRARVAQVRSSITVPPPTAIAYLYSSGRIYAVPPATAYGALLRDLGFTLDDTLAKAPGARLASTGDSFEIGPEQVGTVLNAPHLQLFALGGPPLAQIAQRPEFAALPAFRTSSVVEMPAFAYRPDYPAVLATLDVVAQRYRR